MSYLKLQAEKFLRFHTQSWRNLGEIEDTTHLVGGHHGEWKLFGQLHRTFDTNQEEVNQGLINPTAIMLDMVRESLFTAKEITNSSTFNRYTSV